MELRSKPRQMRKIANSLLLGLMISVPARAATYYVATNGNDVASGDINHPFATLSQAQAAAGSGDTVYIRGGTYTNMTVAATDATYQYGLNFTKSNISYLAYPGDSRPILDFTSIQPTTLRVCAIQVTGTGNTFKGFDVTGVTAGTLKQADNWRITGNSNTFNQIVTRNDQGNGFYFLSHSSNNLVLNCDSHDLVGVNGISAGNTDGFGCHSAGTGNVFRGDRSWANSDDGYDCISNTGGGVTFDHCWAYDNGRLDGNKNGFKIGGFGNTGGAFPDPPPVHTVIDCLAANNGANGFYANHQPGQAANWYNNTAYNNHGNFNMLEAIDTSPANSSVAGTREVLHNNLAFTGTGISNINESGDMVANNWYNLPVTVSSADFLSTDATQMILPRQADGSLPNITFMHLAANSDLIDKGIDVGLPYIYFAPDLGAFEVPEPSAAAAIFGVLVAVARRRR